MSQLLSLVVPAYKQEKTIAKNIKLISKVLSNLSYDYELIVVVDGNLDDTFKNASKLKSSKVKILGYEKNRGKGYAVKFGALKAKGDMIGFIDAGMDLDISAITILVDYMDLHNADIVIGSKLHPDSVVEYPLFRVVLSWGYRTIIKSLFNLNVRDTQVGMKLFRRNVVKKVFPKILVRNFAFDIEVLAVSSALGYGKIFEAPIKLKFNPGSISSSNFWKVVFWMLVDTFAVFYRLKVLNYYGKKK